MKDLQPVIDAFLERRRKRRKYIIIMVMLMVIVIIAVPVVLLMPADSMTGELTCNTEAHSHTDECYTITCNEEHEEHSQECYNIICGFSEHEHSEECYKSENNENEIVILADNDIEYFETQQTSYPGNSNNFESFIVNIDGSDRDDNTFTGLYGSIENTSDPDVKTADFKISYAFDENSKGMITEDNPYIHYILPEGMSISDIDVCYGESCQILQGDILAGYYSVANMDDGRGLIVIRFVKSYIQQFIDNSMVLQGSLIFTSNILRDNTNVGDRTLEFGKDENDEPVADITVAFYDKGVELSKTGTLVNDGNGNLTADWTITINNPAPETNLNGCILEDTMFGSMSGTPVIEPAGVLELDSDTGMWTFNDFGEGATVTFKYTTVVDDMELYTSGGKTIVNIAAVKDENKTLAQDTGNLAVSRGAEITKTGTPDYKSGKEMNKKIDWKINLKSNYGKSLNGYIVNDSMFTADMEGVTVTDTNGQTIGFTVSDGLLTIADDVTASEIIISYQGDAVYDDSVGYGITSNSASITYPDKVTPGAAANNINVTYSPIGIQKSAYTDYDNQCIKWTIKVWNDDGNKTVLDGYKLKDSFLAGLSESDITLSGAYNGNDWQETEMSFTKDGDTLTFSTEDAIEFSITYSTPVSSDDIQNGNDVKMENTVTLSNPNDTFTASKTVTATYKSRNSLKKSLIGESSASGNADELSNQTLGWVIEMAQDTGFIGGDKTLVDIMKAVNQETSEAMGKHYMTSSQISDISVEAKVNSSDTEWTPVDSSYYMVEYTADENGNTSSFTLTFTSDEDGSSIDSYGYKIIQVKYNTTADLTDVPKDTIVVFTNEASFNNLTAGENSKYSYSVLDPDYKPYSKHYMDKDEIKQESKTPEVLYENLLKATIDNTEYYVFGWEIYFDGHAFTLKDVLPEGFTLCTDNIYKPKIKYASNDFWDLPADTWSTGRYAYDASSDIITFMGTAVNIEKIRYYTKITVTDFENMFSSADETGLPIINTISDESALYPDDTVTVTVKSSVEEEIEPSAEPLLEKIYNKNDETQSGNADTSTNGRVSYTLDINPNGDTLANGGNLTIKDIFKTVSYTPYNETIQYGAGLLDVQLDSLKVYKVNNSGSRIELSSDEYSYLFNPDPQSRTDVEVTKEINQANKIWFFKGVKGGDEVTITVKDEPNSEISIENYNTYNQIHLIFSDWEWTDPSADYYFDNYLNENEPFKFGESGEVTLKYTVPDGCNVIQFRSWQTEIDDVNVTARRPDSAAEFEITVPDSQHLQIDYTYQLTKDGKVPGNEDIIVFSNTAELSSGNSSASDSVDEITLEMSRNSGESYTDPVPRIKKVDAGNHNITLSAKFKLGKYDAETQSWLWMQDYTLKTNVLNETVNHIGNWDSEENAVEISVNGEYLIAGLESGVLYTLKETVNPEGYEDVSRVNPFYFTYASSLDEYPDGISSSDITKILAGGEITVPNNQLIDINVFKQWCSSDENADFSNASVEAVLYWSYKNVDNGFPDESELFEASAENLNLDSLENPKRFSSSCVWEDIPNGKNGSPVYYYVKETAYTVDGTVWYSLDDDGYYRADGEAGHYKPNYSGNAVNKAENRIDISNANMLTVQKVWYDNSNNDISSNQDIPESVSFELWGSETEDGEKIQIMNGVNSTFTITKADNWEYEINPEYLEDYQYFEVKEIDVSDIYRVNVVYYNNGQTGLIKIINKNNSVESNNTSIKVEKIWIDNESPERPDVLEFKLYRSTDKQVWEEISDTVQPTPEIDSNKWTYNYNNLPLKNEDNVDYYYKISESVPEGYIQTGSVNNDGIQSGTITITNTRTAYLTIAKLWIDSKGNAVSGSEIDKTHIKIKLYRSVQQADNTDNEISEETGMSVNLPENAEFIQEVVVNKDSGTWSYTLTETLPFADNSGNIYYYYIVEETMEDCIPIQYNGNGLSLENKNPQIIITNRFKVDSDSTEMPSTGGHGTTFYYLAGTLLILCGIVIKYRSCK